MKYLGTPHNRFLFLVILVLAMIVTSIDGNLARFGMRLFGGPPAPTPQQPAQPLQ